MKKFIPFFISIAILLSSCATALVGPEDYEYADGRKIEAADVDSEGIIRITNDVSVESYAGESVLASPSMEFVGFDVDFGAVLLNDIGRTVQNSFRKGGVRDPDVTYAIFSDTASLDKYASWKYIATEATDGVLKTANYLDNAGIAIDGVEDKTKRFHARNIDSIESDCRYLTYVKAKKNKIKVYNSGEALKNTAYVVGGCGVGVAAAIFLTGGFFGVIPASGGDILETSALSLGIGAFGGLAGLIIPKRARSKLTSHYVIVVYDKVEKKNVIEKDVEIKMKDKWGPYYYDKVDTTLRLFGMYYGIAVRSELIKAYEQVELELNRINSPVSMVAF